MNTNQSRRFHTSTIASAIAVVLITVASPATAQPFRNDSPTRTSEQRLLGFGTPLTALDGQSLAQYVQAHHRGDHRTFTGV